MALTGDASRCFSPGLLGFRCELGGVAAVQQRDQAVFQRNRDSSTSPRKRQVGVQVILSLVGIFPRSRG